MQPLSLWLGSQQQSPLKRTAKTSRLALGLKPFPRYEIRFDCAAFGETCVSTLPEGAVTYSTYEMGADIIVTGHYANIVSKIGRAHV